MSEAVDRLVADAVSAAAARRRVPGATYRLQVHAAFPIPAATRIVPYLHALGITHAYTSPLLAARPGSTHGYDVADHERLNPEAGTEDDLAAWSVALRERGMGLLLDCVPNHMAVGTDNPWWADVLEHGPSSPFAGHFDIAWDDHPRERLHGKVLLPVLGEPFGQALESGGFRPRFADGAFAFELYGKPLPADPRTYGVVLAPAADAVRAAARPDDPDALELQSILTAVKHLPPRGETDPARVAEGRAESAVVKRRLAALAERSGPVRDAIDRALSTLAGTPGDPASFAALDGWLDAQAYRPAFWRVAADEINYRRFFDVNELAAISAEREDVFVASHRKLYEWLLAGHADGLRIDHPDGLYDPKKYLRWLQAGWVLAAARHRLAARPADYPGLTWGDAEPAVRERVAALEFERRPPLYVVAEKILGYGEPLPDDWATDGTTGYEFAVAVNGLFVNADNEAAVTSVYQRFTGQTDRWDELLYRKKFLILQTSLASELHVLAHQLDRLAQMERWSRDFTLNGLRHALREVIACFPVYRSYVDGTVRDSDKARIHLAVRKAKRRSPTLGPQVFDFVRDSLLLKDPPSGPASADYRDAQVRFAGKFQQVTSPVMAKGLEDTAMYVFNRLLSLNEVGGDPGRFGTPPAKLHAFLADRAEKWPGGLSPLSTHDTKRSEDVRARVNVLSEVPGEWGERVGRWAAWNARHRVAIDDETTAPDANEEYLLYQTLVGAWPLEPWDDPAVRASFTERVRGYMNKALHEAKAHTSWINPNAEYDAAVGEFIGRVLDPGQAPEFLADLRAFAAEVARLGAFNSLAQTLLRCTAPGVPDTYQGTELWDLSLVDPDNRRPVDYDRRVRLLNELDERAAGDRTGLCRELLESWPDGRVKLYVTSRALRFRRDAGDLFAAGDYAPVGATGPKAEHLFAFARTRGDRAAVVVVPRLVAGLGAAPVGEAWGDTAMTLPEPPAGKRWADVLTGAEPKSPRAADVLAAFPVSLLEAR